MLIKTVQDKHILKAILCLHKEAPLVNPSHHDPPNKHFRFETKMILPPRPMLDTLILNKVSDNLHAWWLSLKHSLKK